MRLVFLGAPGVGKGTQAKRLQAQYGWVALATGDLLREAITKGTPLGLQAKAYLERGDLVPDSLVNELVREYLQTLQNGFILDGYPRTVVQARYLDQLLQDLGQKLDKVVKFDLSEQELIERLSGRRICPQCGAIYHVKTNPSREGERCERCHATLVTRADDQPETIQRRLKVYQEQTQPLIDYYSERGLLLSVPAQGEPDAVFEALIQALNL